MKWKVALITGLLVSGGLAGCDAGLNSPLGDLNLPPAGGGSSSVEPPAIPSGSTASTPVHEPEGCTPTADQQAMLTLVNEARAAARNCGDEAFGAAQPLTWNCQLADAARVHSQDMSGNNFFSHTGSDGLKVSDRVTATGYSWRAVGENIAAGYSDESQTVTALLGSPGHCANIMNPDFREFGSAVAFTDRVVYPSYWTQVFATRFPSSANR